MLKASHRLYAAAVLWYALGQAAAFGHALVLSRTLAVRDGITNDLIPLFRTVAWESMIGTGGAFACAAVGYVLGTRERRVERQHRQSARVFE